MPNVVIWIIFGILIAVLVGFMVISWVRDKKKTKEITRKKIELRSKKAQKSKELAVRINLIIEKNEIEVKKVISQTSKFKMKNINFLSKSLLNKIKKDKIFKLLYVNSTQDDLEEEKQKGKKEETEMAKNLDVLINTKSNMWKKSCQKEIEFFKKLDLEFQKSEEYQEYYASEKADIDKVFDEAEFAQ